MEQLRHLINTLRQRALQQWTTRTPSENAFLFLLPIVGVAVGLLSAGTAHLIAFLQSHFWGRGENLLAEAEANPWFLRLIIPATGGLLVGAIGWLFKVPTRGGGVTTIIQAVSLRGGVLSLRQTVPRDSAAMVTIATGGSLGREGAMAMFASAIGSKLGRQFNLSTHHLRMLVCAAAAAALAAVYNAPIGGALFALEVLMGSFALDVLGPVVVVTVIATLVSRSCMGNLPRFTVPRYDFVSGWELFFYLGLGLLAALAALVFVKLIFGSQDLFEKLPFPKWLKPAIGLMLVGCIGVYWPEVFGNGFEPVNLILQEKFLPTLLVTLLAMKIFAVALSFGSGGAGGLFTPSLMVGALLGGAYGYGVHHLFPHITADYGAYAIVGMGGVLAGMTHAPLMAIMMIFEQTNSYQIVLPLMFVCVISHFTVARILRARSMEEESLLRRGIQLPRGPEEGIMQTLRVADVMHEELTVVKQSAPFPEIVEAFLRDPHNNLWVIDDAGKFLGAIRLHSLKEMLHQSETLTTVIARDLVDENFDVLTPTQCLGDTMERFWKQNCERLPVVADTGTRKLVGWISKRDLMGVYSQEILQKRPLLGKFRIQEEDGTRDVLVELPEGLRIDSITVPSVYAGQTLGELALRSTYNLHVLQVKRRDPLTGLWSVQLATVSTRLLADDQLVVIGPPEGLAQLQLNTPS